MKRVITIVIIGVLTGVAAPAALAWAPTDQRLGALERQVKLLNKEVKTLKAQVRVLRDTVDSMQMDAQHELKLEKNRDLCVAVGVEDLLQSTWVNVDQRFAPLGETTAPAFGPQQLGGDPSCPLFGVVRPGISNHPNVDFFSALISAFIG